MEKLFIDQSWSFKQLVYNIKALKSQYEEILASFSFKQAKEKNEAIKFIRNQIYSLKFEDWKKERAWEYINGDIDFDVFDKII